MITRAEEMDAQAEAFHKANPEVARLFMHFTKQMISRGFKNYSSMSIIQRIRWETDQADVEGQSSFKINNNYAPWYARRFMEAFPEYEGFFRTRKRTSENKKATNLPELTPAYFDD